MSPRLKNILGVIALFVLAGIAGLLLQYRGHHPTLTDALNTLSTCFTRGAGTEDTVDGQCMDERVTHLLEQYSTHAVMSAINSSSSPPVVVRNCHIIGHLIGHKTYAQIPNLEQAFNECTISCRHACMHGAITEAVQHELGEGYTEDDLAHAGSAALERIGKRYCDKGRLLCHAIGHMIRINSSDYPTALATCDRMGTNREMCYSGVFMEDASVIESSVTNLKTKPAVPETYTEPCSTLASKYRAQCYRYLPMYQSNLFTKNDVASSSAQSSIMRSACESLPTDDRDMCFFGLGAYANRLREQDGRPVDQATFCDAFAEKDRIACDTGIVRTIMTNVPPAPTRLFAYCDSRDTSSRQEYCYHVGFKIAELTAPKNDAALACATPHPELCRAAQHTYHTVGQTLPQYYFGPDGE